LISPYRNSRKPQNMGNWSTSQGSMTCRGLLVDAYEVIGFQIFCFYQSDHLSGFCHTNSWRINGKYWKRIFFANWWKKEGLKKAQGKWYHVWYPKKHVRTCSFEFPTPPSLCFCCLRFCGSLGGFNLYSQPKHIYISTSNSSKGSPTGRKIVCLVVVFTSAGHPLSATVSPFSPLVPRFAMKDVCWFLKGGKGFTTLDDLIGRYTKNACFIYLPSFFVSPNERKEHVWNWRKWQIHMEWVETRVVEERDMNKTC